MSRSGRSDIPLYNISGALQAMLACHVDRGDWRTVDGWRRTFQAVGSGAHRVMVVAVEGFDNLRRAGALRDVMVVAGPHCSIRCLWTRGNRV